MDDLSFENENFWGKYRRLGSERLIIGFGGLGVVGRPGFTWGETLFNKRSLSYISLVPKWEHWWFRGCFGEEIGRLRSIAARYRTAVCYGHSMGGHGALVHGDSLGASAIVASVPQYSIAPSTIGNFDRSWSRFFRPDLHAGMEKTVASSAVDIMLLVDPLDRVDRWHADALRCCNPQARVFPLPFVGHEPLEFLKEIGAVSDVVGGLLEAPGDAGLPRLRVRKGRRMSAIYRDRLDERLAARSKLRSK